MYDVGAGVAQNHKEAVAWFRRAAQRGDPDGQFSLGVAYEQGRGVTKNFKEAVVWFRRAAEQRHSAAQLQLGLMYNYGLGVKKDYNEAVQWYRRLVPGGDPYAQHALGVLYEKGQGVPTSHVIAYALYSVSIAGDRLVTNPAYESREQLLQAMTPEQIEEGVALSRRLASPSRFLEELDAAATSLR